jgi:uncharacterized protein
MVMFCLCASIASSVMPGVISAASFDCGKASSEVEKTICSDDEHPTSMLTQTLFDRFGPEVHSERID